MFSHQSALNGPQRRSKNMLEMFAIITSSTLFYIWTIDSIVEAALPEVIVSAVLGKCLPSFTVSVISLGGSQLASDFQVVYQFLPLKLKKMLKIVV